MHSLSEQGSGPQALNSSSSLSNDCPSSICVYNLLYILIKTKVIIVITLAHTLTGEDQLKSENAGCLKLLLLLWVGHNSKCQNHHMTDAFFSNACDESQGLSPLFALQRQNPVSRSYTPCAVSQPGITWTRSSLLTRHLQQTNHIVFLKCRNGFRQIWKRNIHFKKQESPHSLCSEYKGFFFSFLPYSRCSQGQQTS